MLLTIVLLMIFGTGFFCMGLIIQPNIITAAMSGSLPFSILGAIFLVVGIALIVIMANNSIQKRNFEEYGEDLYGFVIDVDPLFLNKNGQQELDEYHIEVYVYEQDDSITKQHLRAKTPCRIARGEYCAVRRYKNVYQFVEGIPTSCVLEHIQTAISEFVAKDKAAH